MLITKKYLFKVVENYFTDPLLYQYSLETAKNPSPEDPDAGNEADTEPEQEEEFLWEINPFITRIDKLGLNNTVNDVGE